MAVESKQCAVIFRAQLRVTDVFQSHQRPIGSRFQNYFVKLRRFAEPSHCPHADLVRLPLLRRWLADLPGRHLHVLFLQRAKHIRRCQSALSQFRRVEPQAHGIFALSENDRVADSFDALEGIFYVHVHVVAEE